MLYIPGTVTVFAEVPIVSNVPFVCAHSVVSDTYAKEMKIMISEDETINANCN